MKLSSSLFVFSLTLLASLVHGDRINNELKSSPFTVALQTLQGNIDYNFKSIDLLRRAMTHPSYSRENNRALSILGLNVIEASVSLRYLERNIDVPAKDLSRRIAETVKVDSCAAEGLRLGLDQVVRVSEKTNSTIPAVVVVLLERYLVPLRLILASPIRPRRCSGESGAVQEAFLMFKLSSWKGFYL